MKDKGKLLMLLLIGSESFFFIALIIAYVYYRNFTGQTDTVAANLDAGRTGVYTLLLVGSSATLSWGEARLSREDWRGFRLGILATIVLAAIFLGGQIMEYAGLYAKQVTLSADVFGSSFFTLTGFHGLHVFLGVVALSVLLLVSFGGWRTLSRAGIGGVGVYWHFVDAVWLVVFFFVYLKPLL